MIPQLRFPQFTDEWQKVKLSDVAKKGEYGMNAAAKSFDGINKYLRITDIDDETRKMLTSNITSPSGVLEDKYLLKQGDITIARTGASTGKSYIYNSEDAKVYFAGFLIRFRVNDASPYFVYLQTLRKSYDKWIAAVSARSGQPGVNAEEYGTYSFYLPSHPEQEKIAEFLTAVDGRIGKIEKKLELLQQYKKGVMQKIFTQQIRFKDEDGNLYPEWIEKKLGSLCQIAKSGGTPTATNRSYYNNGNIPFLAISDITEQGKYLTRTSKFINESGLKNSASWIVPVGSLIYSMYASVGFVSINKIPMATSQAVINLVPNSQVSVEFLYYFLSDYKRKVHRFIETGTQGNLNAQTVKNIPVSLPYSEEQQKIAIFLAALDDKIKAEQTRLAAAKQWKKGLLQRMFV